MTRRHDGRSWSLHAERSLEATNDFSSDISVSDPGLAELIAFAQPRDYVDRRTLALSLNDIRRSFDDAIVSAQIGIGEDRSEVARVIHHPLSPDTVPFNRASAAGHYVRLSVDYELHPDRLLGGALTGVSSRMHYEAASGRLHWQRATAGVTHRTERGALRIAERVDVGIVTASHDLPPQQLFELGGSARLAGYSYKQFAGGQAAVASAGGNYVFPGLRTLRLRGNLRRLPPLAPGIGASVEMGWTALTNDSARNAVLALSGAASPAPLSVATDGVRGSAGVGLTLFSGLFHAGVARSFDRGAPWRAAIGIGSMY